MIISTTTWRTCPASKKKKKKKREHVPKFDAALI